MSATTAYVLCALGVALVALGFAQIVNPCWYRRQRPAEPIAGLAEIKGTIFGHSVTLTITDADPELIKMLTGSQPDYSIEPQLERPRWRPWR